jgi:predicted PhzF superfamily epimerase YddE/YHI9
MKTFQVFVDDNGNYGNPVGCVIDEKYEISDVERQNIAKQSGFSEIVFINDIKDCDVSIYTPLRQIRFAGHALVGAAKYLSDLNNTNINQITSQNNIINVRSDKKLIFVQGSIDILPDWNYEEMVSPEDITNLSLDNTNKKHHCMVWAWVDKEIGIIRARTFASDWGILEDEANGSGAMRLSNQLKHDIKIIHGKGSIIYSKYIENNIGEVGGNIMQI